MIAQKRLIRIKNLQIMKFNLNQTNNSNFLKNLKVKFQIYISLLVLQIFKISILKNKYGLNLIGPYKNFKEAKKNSVGYESPIILDKINEAIIKTLDGKSIYERDGCNFSIKPKKLYIRNILKKYLRDDSTILDFGGSLGSNYINNKDLFTKKNKYKIVEQINFVKQGNLLKKKYDIPIQFYSDINEIKSKVDILILSSVLHYLEDTKFLFKFINRINPEIIIIDRTPFNFKKKNNWWIQYEKSYYKIPISYPIKVINIFLILNNLNNYSLTKTWINDFDAKFPPHIGILLKKI